MTDCFVAGLQLHAAVRLQDAIKANPGVPVAELWAVLESPIREASRAPALSAPTLQ